MAKNCIFKKIYSCVFYLKHFLIHVLKPPLQNIKQLQESTGLKNMSTHEIQWRSVN